MLSSDLTLIKMITDHYYIKRDKIVNRIEHNGRIFYDKFERVDAQLTPQILRDHADGKVTVAHSLINKQNIVENIVFDYNGRMPEKFWHRAQLMLREEGYLNFTAYATKTPGHLHLYIHKGHTLLSEGQQLAHKLSVMLSQRLPTEWRVFPNLDMPKEFQILTVPYDLYQKERGTSWSRHM